MNSDTPKGLDREKGMDEAGEIESKDTASRGDECVLSWERWDELGLFRAAFRTASEVLECDEDVHKRMAAEREIGEPLLYLCFSLVACIGLWTLIPLAISARYGGGITVRAIVVLGGVTLASPMIGIVGAGVMAAILHGTAWLCGARKRGLEATFRVVCYLMGGCAVFQCVVPWGCILLALVPVVILLLAFVVVISLSGNAERLLTENVLMLPVVAGLVIGCPIGYITGMLIIGKFVKGCREALKTIQGIGNEEAARIVKLASVTVLGIAVGICILLL